MKRAFTSLIVSVSAFLLVFVSIHQSVAQHKVLAQNYLSEGLYDEAMQEYHQSTFHQELLKGLVHLFGEFNAFLAILGTLFILSGLLLKKPLTKRPVKKIKFTEEFNEHQNI